MFAARNALLTGGLPAPAYSTTGAGNAASVSSGGTLTWTDTIGASDTGITVVIDGYSASPTATVTCKVGSTSMTLASQLQNYYFDGSGYCALYFFTLLNPPTGSQTITATPSLADAMCGNSTTYTKVTGFGIPATNTGTTTAASLSVPSGAGQLVVAGLGGYATAWSAFNQTSRWNEPFHSGVNLATLIGDAPGASSVSFTGTTSATGWGAIGVPVL